MVEKEYDEESDDEKGEEEKQTERIENIVDYSKKIRTTRQVVLVSVIFTSICSIILGFIDDSELPKTCARIDKACVIVISVLATVTACTLAVQVI